MSPSKKFLLGLILSIGNFILGKLALPFFAFSMEWGLAIYLFSWIMLIAGLVLCGREGLTWARVYYHHLERWLKSQMLKSFKQKDAPKELTRKTVGCHNGKIQVQKAVESLEKSPKSKHLVDEFCR